MRACREKHSSYLRYLSYLSPAQFIKHWLPVMRWRSKRKRSIARRRVDGRTIAITNNEINYNTYNNTATIR